MSNRVYIQGKPRKCTGLFGVKKDELLKEIRSRNQKGSSISTNPNQTKEHLCKKLKEDDEFRTKHTPKRTTVRRIRSPREGGGAGQWEFPSDAKASARREFEHGEISFILRGKVSNKIVKIITDFI